jgi:hypothetical protein
MFLREQYKREEESEIKRVFIMPTYPTRISNSVCIHTCDKDTSSNPIQCAFYRSINCCVVCVCRHTFDGEKWKGQDEHEGRFWYRVYLFFSSCQDSRSSPPLASISAKSKSSIIIYIYIYSIHRYSGGIFFFFRTIWVCYKRRHKDLYNIREREHTMRSNGLKSPISTE